MTAISSVVVVVGDPAAAGSRQDVWGTPSRSLEKTADFSVPYLRR